MNNSRLRKFVTRRNVLVSLATVSLIVFFVLWTRHRAKWEDLDVTANRLYSALESGNTRTLYKYLYDEEKSLLDMSHGEFASMYDWAFEDFDFTGAETDVIGNGYLRGFGYTGTKVYRTVDGNTVSISINILRTPDGPRTRLTSDFLNAGLDIRYGEQFMGEENEMWRILHHGLPLERNRLEQIGLDAVYTSVSPHSSASWDELLAGAEIVLNSSE